MITNRQAHEEAAGYNLDNTFFSINGIDPDALFNIEMVGAGLSLPNSAISSYPTLPGSPSQPPIADSAP